MTHYSIIQVNEAMHTNPYQQAMHGYRYITRSNVQNAQVLLLKAPIDVTMHPHSLLTASLLTI
jgi:hypothetical protein